MLIQAYCQQEREKRCTITAKAAELNAQDIEESSDEKMDTDETDEQTADGTKTPKIEPNRSPTPNDVEMIDTSEPITAIKQEPEDEVTNIETDPLAEGDDGGDDDSGGGSGGKSDDGNGNSGGGDGDFLSAIKNDTKDDSQQSENQTIKIESDENCNDCISENNNENPSASTTTTTTDEPIKIEESTADKDDPYSKDINIDPRTYCKLGHFHLLLEDYAKGMYE